MTRIVLLLIFPLFALHTTAIAFADEQPKTESTVTKFVHPGVLHSEAELTFIKQKIADGEEPWKSAWEELQSSRPSRSRSRRRSSRSTGPSSLEYKPKPYAKVVRGASNNPDIGSSEFSNDGIAAYAHALQWRLTGKQTHATKSIEILNAWSKTLKSISGHDGRLLIGMSGIAYCNAAELVRHSDAGWKVEDQQRFEQMLRKVFYPVIQDFILPPMATGMRP